MEYKGSVSTLIYKGRVMLIGYVRTEKDHKTLLDTLSRIKGISEVLDHVVIGAASLDPINDTYLSQSLQSALFFDTRIRSQNYHITASHKKVYIVGTAGSDAEKAQVLEHAEQLAARGVISDIRIEQKQPALTQNPRQ